MAPKERREREKQDLRQKILDAAQSIINEEGFAALTMRKLADHIEYSAASLYLHFRSREQIAQELCVLGYGRLLDALSASSPESDPIGRLRAMAKAYVSFGLEHPETYRLIFMGDSAYMEVAFADRSPESPAHRSFQLIVDVADELKHAGLFTGPASAAETAELLWSALHGIVSLRLTCPGFEGAPTGDLTEMMVSTLLYGLIDRPRASVIETEAEAM